LRVCDDFRDIGRWIDFERNFDRLSSPPLVVSFGPSSLNLSNARNWKARTVWRFGDGEESDQIEQTSGSRIARGTWIAARWDWELVKKDGIGRGREIELVFTLGPISSGVNCAGRMNTFFEVTSSA